MPLPCGDYSFAELIRDKLDIVDKTLFIKEVLDDSDTRLSVITYPEKFGKTYNLSMLHHFLAYEVRGMQTARLFDGLKITNTGSYYREQQGKYPVITTNFSHIQGLCFQGEDFKYERCQDLMTEMYSHHTYLLDSLQLSKKEKEAYSLIIERKITEETILTQAIQALCRYLYQHHSVKPWLLIDNYNGCFLDAAFYGYSAALFHWTQAVLQATLKNNPYLHRAVMMGSHLSTDEALLFGLHHLTVYSEANKKYAEYFGFTEREIKEVLRQARLESLYPEVEAYYKGSLQAKAWLF